VFIRVSECVRCTCRVRFQSFDRCFVKENLRTGAQLQVSFFSSFFVVCLSLPLFVKGRLRHCVRVGRAQKNSARNENRTTIMDGKRPLVLSSLCLHVCLLCTTFVCLPATNGRAIRCDAFVYADLLHASRVRGRAKCLPPPVCPAFTHSVFLPLDVSRGRRRLGCAVSGKEGREKYFSFFGINQTENFKRKGLERAQQCRDAGEQEREGGSEKLGFLSALLPRWIRRIYFLFRIFSRTRNSLNFPSHSN